MQSIPGDGYAITDWSASVDLPRLIGRQLVALRALLEAAACSVALLNPERQLVFVAAAGAGADAIVGTEIGHDRGIAGWVLSTGQALSISDITTDDRFAHDVAAATGYVPTRITALPIMGQVDSIGVLEVLDAPTHHLASSSASMAIGVIAESVADLVETFGRAIGAPESAHPAVAAFARLADVDPTLASHVEALLSALSPSRESRRR